ncbi:MAG: ribosomal protein S18-alanine N-acetyltransferase [Fibrobacter sp.]|jgi:ribosomal-protein-alanine N-acetyltransferase|nr:ribosomal protein S18-alanine N-acetyltransferase [Fibrobacter sp.]
MLFRKIQIIDIEAIFEIQEELKFQTWSLSQLESSIKSGLGFLIEKESVLAYAFLMPIQDEAELLSIAVKKDYQKQGIASLLWKKTLEYLENLKIQKVYLEVRASNKIAQSFYKKNGFLEIYERKNYYSNQENAIVMQFKF